MLMHYKTMPTFIMLVGLPASGKTTFARKLKIAYSHQKEEINIHSSDAVRERLFSPYREYDRNKNRLVFEILHEEIKEDLRKGISVIYDATNINYKRRKAFLNEIKSICCYKVCQIMATPYIVCVQRNKERNNKVPDNVIENMLHHFYVPQYYEGWDSIYINTFNNCNKEKLEDLKIKTHLFNQNNKYHNYTLDLHLRYTKRELEKLLNKNSVNKDREILLTAAEYHDIGKLYTRKIKDNCNFCIYPYHNNVGAYLFLTSDTKLSGTDIINVCNYIQHHMQLYNNNFDETNFVNLVGKTFYNNLKLLYNADILAH